MESFYATTMELPTHLDETRHLVPTRDVVHQSLALQGSFPSKYVAIQCSTYSFNYP